MCSEIDHSSSALRRMSGSDKPQIIPVDEKEDEREGIIVPGHSSQRMSGIPGSFPEIVSETENLDYHQKKPEEIKDKEETDPKATASNRKSDKQISENDDGFRTPTSSDHRIPAITQCPPAPKKPPPQPSKQKRKASPPLGACRSLQLDASTAEVESIFRPIPNDQDDAQDQKIKKSRTDDKDRL